MPANGSSHLYRPTASTLSLLISPPLSPDTSRELTRSPLSAQDLAIHCVHAASPALASSLRRILGTFHAKKKYQNVDEMLHRVYEPILWRSLTVANPTVRKQSALLFIDAFPIQNPEAPQAEFEHCMQRQVRSRMHTRKC